ncbi:hypothetical protein DYB34_013822 [Aphanomyces astaci]|uniref:FYVE-type domain-containing protein n=1 Tax=Aphanomyces astaci TaxID=112090 RepID=A0A418CE10_APHAT|nr:hypothetical protein DYB34_013822 [Aphanomyces astaci]
MMDVEFVGGGSHLTDKIFGDQVQALRPKTLKPATEGALVRLMQERSAEMVRMHTSEKKACRLSFVKEKRGVSVFEGTNPRNRFMVKGETTVRASIEDILCSFLMGSTSEFDATLYKLFDLYANKGATLAFVTNHPISVHWMALNTDKLETRDVVFASTAQLYEQTTGGSLVGMDDHSDGIVTAGSLVWESVDLAREIPLLRQKLTGYARYYLRTCGFYVEQTNDADITRVSFVLSAKNEAGYIRDSKWMQSLVTMCVANLARTLRKLELVPKHSWKESEHCVLCRKTFRAFRRRHHCRLCGNSVCSDCSKSIAVDGRPVVDQGQLVHVSRVRSCTTCFETSSVRGASSSSLRSSSEYSASNRSNATMSFNEPNGRSSMRSNASTTKSIDHSQGSDVGSNLVRGTHSSFASSFSVEQLHSLDELMAATAALQVATTVSQPPPPAPPSRHPVTANAAANPPLARQDLKNESAFFALRSDEGHFHYQEQAQGSPSRDSYNTLDDRSSASSSVVYDIDGTNGFDITGLCSRDRLQPDPEPAAFSQFKVLDDAIPPPAWRPLAVCNTSTASSSSGLGGGKPVNMRGDMILLE